MKLNSYWYSFYLVRTSFFNKNIFFGYIQIYQRERNKLKKSNSIKKHQIYYSSSISLNEDYAVSICKWGIIITFWNIKCVLCNVFTWNNWFFVE
jgi:hypothetical protein